MLKMCWRQAQMMGPMWNRFSTGNLQWRLTIYKFTSYAKILVGKHGYKRTLFNETRQYNIQMFDKTIFLKYRTRQIKATETNKEIT